MLGLLVAFAIRSRVPRLRWTSLLAIVTSLGHRRRADRPDPAARGDLRPAVLRPRPGHPARAGGRRGGADGRAASSTRSSTRSSSASPASSSPPAGAAASPTSRSITVASDLHNNTVGLGVLERLSNGGPVFFVGDLTDRGSQLETSLVRRVAHSGKPFVFVTRQPRLRLPRAARSRARGRSSSPATAGCARTGRPTTGSSTRSRACASPATTTRTSAAPPSPSGTATTTSPDPAEQDKFTGWLMPLIGKVDVVMVHEPALIAPALQVLRDQPPEQPLVFLVGHTHKAALAQAAGRDRDQRREHRRGRDRQPDRDDEPRRSRASSSRSSRASSRWPRTWSRSTRARARSSARRERLDPEG